MVHDRYIIYTIYFTRNMVPVPFIILYLKKLASFLSRKSASATRIMDLLFERARRKAAPVEEFQWLGLMLFVAVPFPGTGAWTGAIIASVLGMPFWSGFSANFVGVVLAGLLVNLLMNLGLKYAIITGIVLFFVSTVMWGVLRSMKKSLNAKWCYDSSSKSTCKIFCLLFLPPCYPCSRLLTYKVFAVVHQRISLRSSLLSFSQVCSSAHIDFICYLLWFIYLIKKKECSINSLIFQVKAALAAQYDATEQNDILNLSMPDHNANNLHCITPQAGVAGDFTFKCCTDASYKNLNQIGLGVHLQANDTSFHCTIQVQTYRGSTVAYACSPLRAEALGLLLGEHIVASLQMTGGVSSQTQTTRRSLNIYRPRGNWHVNGGSIKRWKSHLNVKFIHQGTN